MRYVLKNSLFSFLLLSLVVGNSFASVSFNTGFNVAKAQELGEVTEEQGLSLPLELTKEISDNPENNEPDLSQDQKEEDSDLDDHDSSELFGLFSVFGNFGQGNNMTICHFPPGNPGNPQTMTINTNAWPAHQGHGDYQGECINYPAPVVSAQFDQNGDVLVSWDISSHNHFYQYKVIVSETDPSPDTLSYPDDGYMPPAITNKNEKSRVVPKSNANYNGGDFGGNLECGQTYYFSVTARYKKNNNHPTTNVPGNTVSLTVQCDEPQVPTTTILAHKIVCDSEEDLPNLSSGANITATTAQQIVDNSDGKCRFQENWEFQWGKNDSLLGLPGNFVGKHVNAGWYDFDTQTGPSGQPAQVQVATEDMPSRLWFREVLQEAYIPFSFPSDEYPSAPGSDVSAEFWCHSDVLNYDNAEWIDIASDTTYYCVAINALKEGEEPEDPTGIKMCKMDTEQNPLSGWQMNLSGANLIVNGGFETPVLASGTWAIYPNASLTSWEVESGDGLEIQNNAAGASHGGNQLAELDSNNSSVIFQNISTVAGEDYNLKFWYSPRPGRPAGDNTIGIEVLAGANLLWGQTIGATAVGGAETDWQLYEANFTAQGATTKIRFADLGTSNSFGGYLDDIEVRMVYSGITGDDGCVLFTDVPYGVYKGTETMQDGWTQVEPNNPSYFMVDYNQENNYHILTFVNEREQGGNPDDPEKPYAPWCSALLGIVSSDILDERYNNVSDINNDGVVNSLDLDLAYQLYLEGNDLNCYQHFENMTSEVKEFYFQCEDPNVGWCGGLEQGINDSFGSVKGDDNYFHVFDLNNDGYINLTDLALFAQLQNDNHACYLHYVPPFPTCTTDPEDPEDPQDPQDPVGPTGGSGGGGSTTPPIISSVLADVSCEATVINWNTNRNSLTWLKYGQSEPLGSESKNSEYNTTHSFTLSGLAFGTTYYYQILSQAQYESGVSSSQIISFATPSAESCGQVLGDKIEGEETIPPQVLGEKTCQPVLHPSGSQGVDKDIIGVFHFPNGTLIRSECDPKMSVYDIRDQQKWHIPTLEYLKKYYSGKRIYNVDYRVMDIYPDWTGQVSGVKEYADGSLLRSPDKKVYLIKEGKKHHISSLEELMKYAGQNIIDVSFEVLAKY
ncbi:MAG: DUF642 domain-containing protein [Patescibacteria group bacterium]|nr:DUF642 domain-containing protein [Patescibacteria group bacterium]